LKENAMNRNLLIGFTAFGLVSAATTASAFAAAAHGHPRAVTAVQASLNYCSHQTGGQKRTAPGFQQCMATRGYQLASTLRATAAARQRVVTQQATASWPAFHFSVGSGDVSSDPTPSAPAYSNQDMLNDLQRTTDANNAATDQNNAAMAAATQTEVLFNTVYFPPNN
jgi:hypothetical protein